ncbi:hypothetical protein PR202_ga11100 [Eleusine coracana subsp. coracana]|uniref:Disease resistance R13L4/SHOC-2-like LRR domain-containing protein n=1 Tax=Eleusine coracana subsp. coracana TaxID=191504 RepID=A0AAV5C8Q4_ELECO|nr:hypothetical protein PR202_ga11100 [Eleusine coracana subsp. coracana]
MQVHFSSEPVQPQDILCYILRQLQFTPEPDQLLLKEELKHLIEKEEAEAQQQEPLICLDIIKYACIVKEVFLTTDHKFQPDKSVQARVEQGGQGQMLDAVIDETVEKLEKIWWKIKEKLTYKEIVDKIQHHLKQEKTMIMLKIHQQIHVSKWEETSDALNQLGCVVGVLIVTTKSPQQAKEYCNPVRNPINYSIVGPYHDTVLQITSQGNDDSSHIFREILEECKAYEFCMKIFAHMFKFSYSDLPKEYKSCLLYLALFPPISSIRWSTLIGRWVAEGLISKEDWPTSVCQAERCFDVLIDRWLIYPSDIGATGKVKSCTVIDLEGCHCFGGTNQHFLKDICNKIILLKYLTQLPSEINNLHALEALDIRYTQVPTFATEHVLLLKLKRLLAGHINPSPSSTDISKVVHVPVKIKQISNMEVMSIIKTQIGRNMDDIGMLWQLRKLGVIIEKDALLINLIGVISNLHECLRSLSITLPLTSHEGVISSRELPADIQSRLTYPPKFLEKLSIHGTTKKGPRLPLLAKGGYQLLRVTLSWTTLNQTEYTCRTTNVTLCQARTHCMPGKKACFEG